MNKYVLIIAAILMSGCATNAATSSATTQATPGDRHFSPAEQREKTNNPELLNCPGNSAPVCDNWTGSRLRKRLTNCRCRSFAGS